MSLRAESLMTPTPKILAEEALIKLPTTEEVRASVRRDAKRLLEPYLKRVQQQRGLTRTLAKQKCD